MSHQEVSLKGHICSGHGCWPPRPNGQGSDWFSIDGIPVHLETHYWLPHTCPSIPETHSSVLAAGSPLFSIDGLQVGRIGDPVACGSVVAQGCGWFHCD